MLLEKKLQHLILHSCPQTSFVVLRRDVLRDKQTPPLSAINYSTVETVDDITSTFKQPSIRQPDITY